MNIIALSYKSLFSRPLSTFLSWLLLSFGVTMIVLILLISGQLKGEIQKNAQGIDMVVGSKGSPMQLILSSIFHIDFPTGNIKLSQAAELSRHRLIAAAIPLSLGDSYAGYRIVGTTQGFIDLYGAELAEGGLFVADMQAAIGAEVAEKLGLAIGDPFESQHGLSDDGDAHGGHPFHVVGILKKTNTTIDKLILVNIQSIWEVHEHDEEEHEHHHHEEAMVALKKLDIAVTQEQLEEEEITSLLIKYKSPMSAVMLPRVVNGMSDLQAASPAYETARLFNMMGTGVKVLNILGVLIIIIAAVSVFISLLNALKDRKYEIAVMRSMGGTREQIFLYVMIEGLLITFLGCLSGLCLAHLMIAILASNLEEVNLTWNYFVQEECWVVIGCLLIGLFSSMIPSVMAYKTDISKILSKG